MSEKIYHQDPYRWQETARIVSSECRAGLHRLILDRTIFCPAGGGQPGDEGTINGIPVVDLIEEDELIVHCLKTHPGEETIRLQIDGPRRFHHMQHHTAQHLLSQVLERELHAKTLSFAIGPEHASIELDQPGLTGQQIEAVEDECARLIFANRPIRVFVTEDVAPLRLRKPPKVTGRIRVVDIDGYDLSACGGTHLRSTGEIGLIKIVRSDRVRANVRLYFTAGHRALGDYRLKHQVLTQVQRLITLPFNEIPAALENLITERDDLSREAKTRKRKELDNEIAAWAAKPDTLIVRCFDDAGIDEMKYFTTSLIKAGKNVVAYNPTLGYVQIGRGSAGGVDLKKAAPKIFSLLSGRGGGRDAFIEGKATDFSNIERVLALLNQSLDK